MTRIRPMFLLMLMVLIPAVMFGGFFGQYLLGQQRRAFDQQLVDRAASLATSLDRELSTHVQLLSVLSESPRLDPPVSAEAFSEIARRLQARIPAWDLVRVTDLDGHVLATVPPRAVKTVNDMTSLRALAASSAPVIGNVSKGPAGNFGFPVRVPVLREGRPVAALTAVLRPSAVSDLIRRDVPGAGWTAWAADATGRLVGAGDPAVPIGETIDTYIADEQTAGDRLSVVTLPAEVVRVASAGVGATGWTVTVGMPLSDYSALSRRTMMILAATCLATIVFSAIAILLFNRELAQRRQQELTVANAQRNDALAKLTGQVAHDFNNLLMVFHSGATAIARRPDDPIRRQKILGSMIEGVERGKEMTQRLLSFSRKSNQTAEVVDLVSLLRDVQPLLRQAANDAITIEYAVDGNVWPAVIEAKSLEIALINLVTNSREAMPDGGRITIRVRNISDARQEDGRLHGPHVALTVSDTGQGIGPASLPRIFEPLFTTKPGGAPGLGLAQVSNFAERSGGAVAVSSVTSVGTSLTIYLPSADTSRSEAKAGETGSAGLPRRMLIVDDTPASLEAARTSFEGEIQEVVTARDGHGALDLLQRRPDLEALLSDIMMPGMSGIELAEAARRLRPDLKIVLMTGYSDRMEQGQRIDFPVVTKPFTQSDVAAAFVRQPKA